MEKETNRYIIDVAPITRLPFAKQQYFSYLCHSKLPAGTLVLVPLFNRQTEGIVLDCRSEFEHDGNYALKDISRIIHLNFLTEKQLILAQKISNYYLTSLGVVLKHFLPKRVKARFNQEMVNVQKLASQIQLTPEQDGAVNEITKERSNKNILLFGPASSGKTEVYIHSIIKLKETNPELQFLILLPELTLAPQAIERYGNYFDPDEIVVLHSKLTDGQFFNNWEKIRNGRAKIIIATRIGIFAPFNKLGLIIIDEEQDMSYKQWDMNPRYDARTVSKILSEIFSCPLVLGTATPRIETYHAAKNNEIKLVQIPILPKEIMGRDKQLPSIEIVDMRKERWSDFAGKKKPNFSSISLKLQQELSYALKNRCQAILFINHQGMSSFSICADCKEALRCPKCDRAIIYDETGTYNCLHCNYKSDIVPTCKKCGSLVFKNIGHGTQSIAREIKKLFPSAKIGRLDTAAIKKPGAQENIYQQFLNCEIEILIGTQMITKGWDNPNVTLIGIIDTDSLFSMPDFLTDERAYNHVMQITGRTGRVKSRFAGEIILQTFNPLNPLFNLIQGRNYDNFFEKEINQRIALKYPPFAKLIKLTVQELDKEKANKNAQKIYSLLQQATNENIRISEPLKPIVSNIRGKHRIQILIKCIDTQALPHGIKKIIGNLSSSWIVDVDPISIS